MSWFHRQKRDWSCGAASISNACKFFGLAVTEDDVLEITGFEPEGLDEETVLLTARRIGLIAKPFATGSRRDAWAWLSDSFDKGYVVVMCADDWGHWIVAGGILGSRILIVDSEDDPDLEEVYPDGYHYLPQPKRAKDSDKPIILPGIQLLTKKELMDRWEHGKAWVSQEHRLYGMRVKKR